MNAALDSGSESDHVKVAESPSESSSGGRLGVTESPTVTRVRLRATGKLSQLGKDGLGATRRRKPNLNLKDSGSEAPAAAARQMASPGADSEARARSVGTVQAHS